MGLRKTFKTLAAAREYIRLNEAVFRMLYIKKDMTAKKVAENQNIHFNAVFHRSLVLELGSKGKGHGGARVGSGNKKGVEFCPVCRKSQSNCICTKS